MSELATRIGNLDDASALHVLSHLTVELREGLAEGEASAVRTADEAGAALVQFLERAEVDIAEGTELVTDANAGARARNVLKLLAQEDYLRDKIAGLVADPSASSQRSLETAVGTAVVLGALISWLQTKVEIRVDRSGAETRFKFHLKKEGSSETLLQTVAESIRSLVV